MPGGGGHQPTLLTFVANPKATMQPEAGNSLASSPEQIPATQALSPQWTRLSRQKCYTYEVEYFSQSFLILSISFGTPVMGFSFPSYSADMKPL